MFVNIRILSGNRQDEEFKIQDGAVIGRKASDLTIKDAKMSSQHARLENRQGELYLVDMGSRNKILVGSKVVEELLLTEGQEFTLGSTLFSVNFENLEEESSPILDKIRELEKTCKNLSREIHPFSQKVVARFLTGPDKGIEYPLGYGPRIAGKDSLDIKLSESYDKECLFRLEERDSHLYFITEYPDHFLVNGEQALAENKIEEKTEVSFANTRIRFEIEK